MKDYYQILRVRRGASLSEIKRAYRILVQQLHPDVNPDPAAHELIKEVNEAYDVLSDDAKRRDYDYRFANPYITVEVPQEPAHRDPRYRRSTTYSHVNVNRGPTERDLMQKLAPSMLKVFQASAVLCLFLLIDFSLPRKVSDEIISSFRNTGRSRYEANYLITQSGQQIKISPHDGYLLEVNHTIQVVRSRILSLLIEVRVPDREATLTNLSTIYANFKFVPMLLGLFSIIGLAARGKIEFRFNLGIMTCFVLIFTVFLLIK
ncbi:MAG TPA: DnaJ domain-containing protein [Cyclobacteriaceae bacterium]|nr:DnaJ domain-containing protein [Cyclobacteriaceae bacterium]